MTQEPGDTARVGVVFARTVRLRRFVRRVPLALGVLGIVVWTLAPVYWIGVTSIRPEAELIRSPPLLSPQTIDTLNYRLILTEGRGAEASDRRADLASRVLPGMRRSVLVALGVIVLAVPAAATAGYASVRLGLRQRRAFLLTIIAVQLIPPFLFLLPFFVLFRRLGLINSALGTALAQASITLPFLVLMFAAYAATLPRDVEWAARVDGASEWSAMRRVSLPLMIPGIVTAIIFAFIISWNEFLMAVTLNSRLEAAPIQPLIAGFYTQQDKFFGLLAAAAFVSAVPCVAVAFLFQRYIVTALGGGTKG